MRRKHTKLNENGFASIVIALVFIVVLALLTVGFAQLARHEQQNALDKQLANQANYAAESGINAALRDIQNGYITTDGAPSGAGIPTVKADSDNCMPASSDPAAATYAPSGATVHPVNSGNGVTYTCLLVSLETDNLTTGGLQPGTGRHMNFGTQDPLTRLTIYWGSDTGNNSNFPPNLNTKFTTLGAWSGNHYPPVMELSLTPTSSLSAQLDPTQYLIDNTTNVYLYPASSGNSTCATNPGPTKCAQGQTLSGDCNPGVPRPNTEPNATDYPCSATITGLGGQNYVIRYTDFYDTSNLYIDGIVSTGGAASFTGEPMIDVTGKARNVLKRLQARYFINGGNNGQPDDNDVQPNGAIEAKNLCKRIQAAPNTGAYVDIGSTYNPPGGVPGSVCDLSGP